MKVYSYARLMARDYKFVILETADAELVEWVTAEVKKEYPNCNPIPLMGLIRSSSLNQTRYGLRILKLGDDDLPVGWWIASMMMNRGWQPFNRAFGPTDENISSPSQSSPTRPDFLCLDLRLEK